jgi:hypothetical protein
MGVVPELVLLMRRVFLVSVRYIVAYFFNIEIPIGFVPLSQLVISVCDYNFSSPQFLLHLFYCCCSLVSSMWGESVPYSLITICFLFPVMIDSSFSLCHRLLLEFLPVGFFHSRFLLPRILLESGSSSIPYFPKAVCADLSLVSPG